jgi:cytochrome c oxidase assembly protein Cox11
MRLNRTFLTVAGLCGALAVMVAITANSVTLYRLFCQVTGANGTTQRASAPSATHDSRAVTVMFDTNTAPGLPWRFMPVQRSVRLRLGQDALVFFTAENQSSREIVGHATFNVTPEKAGIYFKKIQCFCFNEERLAAGARAEMPVEFFVDPALAADPSTEDVHEITLSYTFFESKRPDNAIDLARFAAAPPDAAAGGKLFAERCAACHAPDHSQIGPALAGVVGRGAGTLSGYSYSPALRNAGFRWDAGRLDRWLADPQALVPGTNMPARVPEAAARGDIVAYLAGLKEGS